MYKAETFNLLGIAPEIVFCGWGIFSCNFCPLRGPSLGEGWDVVVRKIDHLDSSLHKALHRMQNKQQEAFDRQLEDLSHMIEDVFESLKHGATD